MENKTVKKRGLSAIYRLCPRRHVLLLISGAVILLHLLLRSDHALMLLLSDKVIHPIHKALSTVNSVVPFSVAELLLALTAAGVLAYLVYQIVQLIRNEGRLRRVYVTLVTLAAFVLAVYAGFCLLWGTYYYGDDFMSRSGLKADKISTEQLETVTEYFARLANEYSDDVPRDENGVYCGDREEILARSPEVFLSLEEAFPCLEGPDIRAKGILCSKVMSYVDFTGFFFPFTAEANVNMDFPPSLLASTVAHELSHQRGVAKEQEANFTAVLACLDYGDADYCYSAALLAYTHLGNALYSADREAWERVYMTLNEAVLCDFAANREYWKQFETPVQAVSNTVYEGFLHSYDQTLGLKSYGACVDLLVNYYYDTAAGA